MSESLVIPDASSPLFPQKQEYVPLVDTLDSKSAHPIACRHFSLTDFPALAAMAKEEVDAGFMVTIYLIASVAGMVDYDDRISGSEKAH